MMSGMEKHRIWHFSYAAVQKFRQKKDKAMRLCIYVFLLLITAVFAGLYQLDRLMVIFLTGSFLLVFLFLISWYLKGKLEAEFVLKQEYVEKNEHYYGKIRLFNKSVLPIVRFRLWITWENQLTGEGGKKTLHGLCPAGSETALEFICEAEDCGKVILRLLKIETCDFFCLFKRKKKLNQEGIFLVLPQENVWDEEPELPGIPEGMGPYVQGDLLRFVHWKLSARTRELFVRKYPESASPAAVVVLEMNNWLESEPQKAEIFLGQTAMVLRGLLDHGWSIRLLWCHKPDISLLPYDEPDNSLQECRLSADNDYLPAMEAVIDELIRRKQKLSGKKGFKTALDLYEKNEMQEPDNPAKWAAAEELLVQIAFNGAIRINSETIEESRETVRKAVEQLR